MASTCFATCASRAQATTTTTTTATAQLKDDELFGLAGVSSDEVDDDDEEEEFAGGGLEQPQQRKKKGSQRPEREPIYDVEALHEKLEDIGWDESGMTWDDTQVITHDDPAEVCTDGLCGLQDAAGAGRRAGRPAKQFAQVGSTHPP